MINRSSESNGRAPSAGLTTVIGRRGAPYLCPSIFAVDQHIGRLYTQIEGTAPCLSELVQDLWADIDLLLERRLFLELDLQVSNVA
jgi:hypothetical protein